MNTAAIFFALLRTEVCGGELTEELKRALSPEQLESVFSLAKEHDLAHIAGQALGRLGVLGSDEISSQFRNKTISAVARYVRLQFEYDAICKSLEAAGIAFIPLKGAVLRQYYPEAWMRTSSDIDVLVKEPQVEEAASVLVEKLNYRRGEKSTHDISLLSGTGVHLELHYDMVEDNRAGNAREVLEKVWEYACPKEAGAYCHCLPEEVFYFYHIAHMAKHLEEGGCGVRTFVDLWILNHRIDFDPSARDLLLKKGGLKVFADAAERLAEVWFSGEKMDAMSAQLSAFILDGGAFGSMENSIAVKQVQMGGAKKYAYRRIFPPFEKMKFRYPVLERHPWLLPVYHVVRWITVLCKGNGWQSLRELEANASMSTDVVKNTAELLKQLEL